jgi:hypothetical protein
MGDEKSDVLHGTLALMVLKTLDTMGPLHGWGIARRTSRRAAIRSHSIRGRSIPRSFGSSRKAG